MKVAVIANAGKTLGGGLGELRRALEAAGVGDPIWHEVGRSGQMPEQVRRAIGEGAELVIAWGGDGGVRRCIDAIGDADVDLAIMPAGTSNLLARSLGIPKDVAQALDVALHGERRRIDVGRFNGERFATMAGAGLDAAMIRGADEHKERLGRAAYVLSGAANLRSEPFAATIEVDGAPWYEGPASCVLVGNIGDLFGGVQVFGDASTDDGLLDLGVLTAETAVQVARAVVRTTVGDPQKSPFVRVTKARKIKVELDRKVRYELDGGDRGKVAKFKVGVEPAAVTVRVPHAGVGGKHGAG